jgi:hypothetical protein
MRPFMNAFVECLRHLAVGVAVLLVLMMTLPVHFHAQTDHQHDHVAGAAPDSAGGEACDASPQDDVDDPDGCGYCHCPTTSLLIPDVPVITFQEHASGRMAFPHPAAAPDSVSYAPDPPPVLLS